MRAAILEQKWLTVVAIPVLLVATYMSWYWIWGCLFLYWALPGLRNGQAYLIEPVDRTRNPVLFWIITAMWAGFGLLTIITDLHGRLA